MKPHGFIAPGEPLVLVEELTHRVIGEYTHVILSIDAAVARASSPEVKAALGASIAILRAYVAAHRALQAPHTPGRTNLRHYLQRLCDALSAARLRERGVHLTLTAGNVSLEAARCWRVGLIVAELVNNAVRHGFGGGEGEIDIEVVAGGEAVLCRVRDNGRLALDAPPARGRFLVEALASELGGHVAWRFSPTGTTVLLAVPRDTSCEIEGGVEADLHLAGRRSPADAIPSLYPQSM